MALHGPREDQEEEQTGEVESCQSGIKVRVKPILDTIRATPLGSGFLALNLGLMAVGAYHESICFAAAPILGGAISLRLAYNQQWLKKRLEELCVTEGGYSDRLFKATTGEWCDRQTARVVAENQGKLEEYTQLCEQNKERATLTWLPHF